MGTLILIQLIIQYFNIHMIRIILFHHHTIHKYLQNRYCLQIDNFNSM